MCKYECGDDPNANCSICVKNKEYINKVTDKDGNIIDDAARFYCPPYSNQINNKKKEKVNIKMSKKYKKAVENLKSFPMSKFLKKAEEELKGKNFCQVEKYIFYDSLDNSFFSMRKASQNWTWAPDNKDAKFYVCVYHSGVEDVFTAEEYLYNMIKSGTVDNLLERHGIEKTDKVKYYIEEQRADKIANLLSEEQKKDLVDETFYFEKNWLKKQAQERIELVLDRFEYRIKKQKESKEMLSQNL